MDAYIDLSYLYSVIVILTIPYYFNRFFNVKFGALEIISLSLFYIVLYFNVFLFPELEFLNIVFLSFYFLIVYLKRGIKLFFGYIFCYYSSVSYALVIDKNLYLYKWLIFINDPKSFYIVVTVFLNIILIEIIMLTIKKIRLLANYRMKIFLTIEDSSLSLSGYMDSGNTLIKNGKPVIFLSERYMVKQVYREMIVSGVGYKKCKYIDGQIVINDRKKDVICAFVNGVSFKGCECLLNIHLLEEENG